MGQGNGKVLGSVVAWLHPFNSYNSWTLDTKNRVGHAQKLLPHSDTGLRPKNRRLSHYRYKKLYLLVELKGQTFFVRWCVSEALLRCLTVALSLYAMLRQLTQAQLCKYCNTKIVFKVLFFSPCRQS